MKDYNIIVHVTLARKDMTTVDQVQIVLRGPLTALRTMGFGISDSVASAISALIEAEIENLKAAPWVQGKAKSEKP